MIDTVSGIFVFIVGVLFLWFGLFRYEWIYKRIEEMESGRIDLLPFISSYWFWRFVFIGMGFLTVTLTVCSAIAYIFP